MTSFANHQELEGAAAEYVIGTLNQPERAAIGAARATNHALNEAISNWELRLAPLINVIPEQTPSPDLFARIEARLLEPRPVASLPPRNLTVRPNYWRGLALSALLAFTLTLGYALHQRPLIQGERIAVLQKDSGAAFMVSLDNQKNLMQVKALGDNALPPDKNFELWLITSAAPQPLPLGVLSEQPVSHLKLPQLSPGTIRDGTLAISMEPSGGSPTGQPTGPVVFTGKFVSTSL